MAGPGSLVPFHNSHGAPFDYFNYICDNPNPSLADLSSSSIINDQQAHLMQETPNQATAVVGDHHCLVDQFIQPDDPSLWNNMFDGLVNGNAMPGDPGLGPSSLIYNNQAQQPSMGETSNVGMEGTSGTDYFELLGTTGKVLLAWPPDPVPFLCSCCLVLRELIHSDGVCTTKLEVHGRIGNISHAVLEIRDSAKSYPAVPEYQMFDFCKKNIMDVAQFMRQYCYDRSRAGFVMLPDPLSLFYQSLCVGLERELGNLCNQNFSNSNPVNLGERETGDNGKCKGKPGVERTAGEGSRKGGKKQPKSALSKQRARTKLITLKDLQEHFHLPIRLAAKRINLCPTVVKNICRRDGMARWPYRKLSSYHRKIRKLKPLVNSSSPEEKANAEAETKRVEDSIARVYAIANGQCQ